MPVKRGVDKKTLVEDNELFVFDDEVEPILSVLCGKTLEISRMEVLEEEELREMREQQDYFKKMLSSEKTDIQRMEQHEAKRQAEFEKMKTQMKEKKRNRVYAHKKVVSRVFAKNYLANLRENTFKHLKDVGFYTDKFKVQVLDMNVVPWLYEKAFGFVQDFEVQDSLPDHFVEQHLELEEKNHLDTT